MKDCIIIPAYNEEKTIAEVVKRSKRFTKTIIVVDDGSKDKTAAVAKRAGAVVLKHKTNLGKGESLKTGIELAKKKRLDRIVIIDADLQYNPEDIPKIKDALGKSDFVMGYRDWKLVPFRHWLGNFVWRSMFNLFFGTKLKDTNCGFIAMNMEAAEKLNFGGGYIIENAMLASAIENKLKISQVKVRINYHHISGIPRGVRIVLGLLIFIIRKGLKYRLGYDRD